MLKNYKLSYYQYKHLIDVFTTGDFLNESLDKQVGLITYRKLLTEDGILYFTQNTKRTCIVPIGIDKRNSSLRTIDLMARGFNYRHSDASVLDNITKLTICYLMQNYNPSEYEVYYDLDIKELEEIDTIHSISSEEELDNIYSLFTKERHKRFINSGVYTYKDYRKLNKDKLIIFILRNPSNINRLESICGAHLRYGVAVINLLQSEISNSSTISLENTIRPIIDEANMENEVKIYKRMLGEYNNMINEINLLTGEIKNEGELHEQLLVKLPPTRNFIKLKDKLQSPSLSEDKRKEIEEIIDRSESELFSIYNMREYGYQFGGLDGNGDYGSFYHHLLRYSDCLDKEAMRYIISGSVYTLFSHSAFKLRTYFKDQKDLSSSDKNMIESYIERQLIHYSTSRPDFDIEEFEEESSSVYKVLYETFFCKVVLKNKSLLVDMNGKEKQLPNYLLYFIDLNKLTLNGNLMELIVRYELYLEYGIHTPVEIYGLWYTDEKYVKSHIVNESKMINNTIKDSNLFI